MQSVYYASNDFTTKLYILYSRRASFIRLQSLFHAFIRYIYPIVVSALILSHFFNVREVEEKKNSNQIPRSILIYV